VKKSSSQKSIGRAFFSSPFVVVLTVATVTVFVFSFAAYARRGGFWSPEVEARVFNEGGNRNRRATNDKSSSQRVFAFQGEVYNEAEQVRESAALTMGTTLLAAQRSLDRNPFLTVERLQSGVLSEGLVPPGLRQGGGANSFSSAQADYYVRYRAEPLAVEVLSIGKAKDAGVVVLTRLPDDQFFENALTYYVVAKGSVGMPAAFTPAAQLIEAGWRPESFKAAEVSATEKEQQRAWLAARGVVSR
jgi:hypothetical protein